MYFFKMRLLCHLKTAAVTAVVFCLLPAGAQTQPGNTATARVAVDTAAMAIVNNGRNASANVTPPPDSIITFEQLNMPIEMEIELSRLTPEGIKLFHDEFQGMHNGLNGEAIRTLKVWYIDDHIIGYVIERPFDASSNVNNLNKKKINIPVTWCCTPMVEGHAAHCVTTLDVLRTTQLANKCTGWHLKLPPPIEFQGPVKLQKRSKKELRHEKDSIAAAFGHTEKGGTRPSSKKKKGARANGFTPSSVDEPAATDSTSSTITPIKDSLP